MSENKSEIDIVVSENPYATECIRELHRSQFHFSLFLRSMKGVWNFRFSLFWKFGTRMQEMHHRGTTLSTYKTVSTEGILNRRTFVWGLGCEHHSEFSANTLRMGSASLDYSCTFISKYEKKSIKLKWERETITEFACIFINNALSRTPSSWPCTLQTNDSLARRQLHFLFPHPEHSQYRFPRPRKKFATLPLTPFVHLAFPPNRIRSKGGP